ncbi:MAG: hypothetical protein GXO69_04215 [Acidobacteria bacterium]|nr:hypothetical protein [Acidobacteriota bacterium]
MKPKYFLYIPFLFVFLFSYRTVFSSDVLRYEDDQGRLVLVDSLEKVPKRYRTCVEVIPSGKQAEMLNAELTRLVLRHSGADSVNKLFDRYLFKTRRTAVLVALFFLTFLLPLFFKHPLSRLNAFFGTLFLFLLFHLIVFVPGLQRRTQRFSGVLRHVRGISFPVSAEIRYKVLSYRIHTEELPLIPVNIYSQLLELREIQKVARVQK